MAIGQTFRHFGPSGVVTFTIEREEETRDGLFMIAGTITEGIEHYVGEHGQSHGSQDMTGGTVGIWVTPDELARGTNEPQRRPTNTRNLH